MPSRQRIMIIVAEYSKEKEMMSGQGSDDEMR